MKRMLSLIGVVPIATASLIAMGAPASAATAGATTATTISSTPSTVTAPPRREGHPDFRCYYRYNRDEHKRQYRCSYRYHDGHDWRWFSWWLRYDPKDPPRGSKQDYPDFKCEYRYNRDEHKRQYLCTYWYKHHDKWYTYQWWWDYHPPRHH